MTAGEWNALDRPAPIPYVQDKAKKAFKVPTVKFQFEREQTKTVTKETQDDHGVPTGAVIEKSTYIKDCKVTLKTFAHSSDDAGEHWFRNCPCRMRLRTQQKCMSMALDRFCFTVSLMIPSAQALLVWMGVAGWGCPRKRRHCRKVHPSCAL